MVLLSKWSSNFKVISTKGGERKRTEWNIDRIDCFHGAGFENDIR